MSKSIEDYEKLSIGKAKIEESYTHPLNKDQKINKNDFCFKIKPNNSKRGPLLIQIKNITFLVKKFKQILKDINETNLKNVKHSINQVYPNNNLTKNNEIYIFTRQSKGVYYNKTSSDCTLCNNKTITNRMMIEIKISGYSDYSISLHKTCFKKLIKIIENFIQQNKALIVSSKLNKS